MERELEKLRERFDTIEEHLIMQTDVIGGLLEAFDKLLHLITLNQKRKGE